jgi:signal transduction histidine kinase
MKDKAKTKNQLTRELEEMRHRIAHLEAVEALCKKAQAELRGARIYAEDIIETVREPLVVLDANLKVLSANRSFYETFRVAPDETIGSFIYDLGNRQWDILSLRTLLEDILPGGTEFNDYVVDHVFPGIGHRIMLLNARRIRHEEPGKEMLLLAIEDITVRKAGEERVENAIAELKRSNADLEQFAYVASHDLKEPLVVIAVDLKLLQRHCRALAGSEVDGLISDAMSRAMQMQALVSALLAYSRVSAAKKKFEQIDFSAALNRVLENLRVALVESGAVVSHDVLPKVTADPVLLPQLLQNLITNAIKFRGEELPRIHISAELGDREWVFSVRDNGIGIPMEESERIFQMFQRLHRDEYPGTGIGLATCKRIVELHGGHIRVTSALGKGSTFSFTIPTRHGDRFLYTQDGPV